MACRQPILLLTAALLLTSITMAKGHGFMFEPKARNVVHNSDYCPHCLSAGGPFEVSGGGSLVWPQGRNGVCGDPANNRRHEPGGVYGPAGVQATYASGQVITISMLLTVQHGGRFAIRLCDRTNADEACFSRNVLQRADGTGPYTWTHVKGGPAIPASGYSARSSYGSHSGELYTMQYRLPAGVTCNNCVLQWWWTTANSCDVPGSPYPRSGMSACNSPGPYPEEFWNCADIAIVGGNGGAVPVNPTPQPSNPTPQPSNPTPQPSNPTPQPSNPTPQPSNPTPQPSNPTPQPKAPRSPRKPSRKNRPGSCNKPRCFCKANGAGVFASPFNCAKFFNCGNGGDGGQLKCPPNTLWDTSLQACNHANMVNCGSRPR